MSTSTRSGVRNASNGRNTRSAAGRRSSTPETDGLGPTEVPEGPEVHNLPPLLGGVNDTGPAEVLEDTEPHPSQPLLGYISCSCPTAIDWQDSRLVCDGRLQEHRLHLDIYWNQAASKAFFRLTASSMQLGSLTHIYIHISPDRINRLSVHQGPQKIFCKQARTFIFDLAEPPTLVLPQELDEIRAAAALDSTTLDVLDAFCSIATQVHFTLHAQVRSSKLSLYQLQRMAASISDGDVGILHHVADTQSLYGGNGASVIEGKDMLTAALPQEIVRNQENNPDLASLPVQQLYSGRPAARPRPAQRLPAQGTRPALGSTLQGRAPKRPHSLLSTVQSVDNLVPDAGPSSLPVAGDRDRDRHEISRELIKHMERMEARIMENVEKRLRDQSWGQETRVFHR